MRYIPYSIHNPEYNMILDSVLLRRIGSGESPATLRLYGWDRPTLSLGRSQNRESLNLREQAGREMPAIVKRPTGGAVAVHGHDLSYSLVTSFPSDVLPRGPKSCYQAIHRALSEALRGLGYEVECVSERTGVNYREKIYCGLTLNSCDIVYENRKVVGSAQRRTARAFLQHGFILLDENFEWVRQFFGSDGDLIAWSCQSLLGIRPDLRIPENRILHQKIIEALSRTLNVTFEESGLSKEEELDLKMKLGNTK